MQEAALDNVEKANKKKRTENPSSFGRWWIMIGRMSKKTEIKNRVHSNRNGFFGRFYSKQKAKLFRASPSVSIYLVDKSIFFASAFIGLCQSKTNYIILFLCSKLIKKNNQNQKPNDIVHATGIMIHAVNKSNVSILHSKKWIIKLVDLIAIAKLQQIDLLPAFESTNAQ